MYMKKILVPLFSFLLVFTLLLGSFGSAKAAVGDDPLVTPISGDVEFTTEVIPIASLPGTTILASQMLVPVGFPEGEAQFEGSGVLVTKFDAGKANACFTISGTLWGWGGKVGMWDGVKWTLLPTTITTTGDDGTSTTACATIAGSGTYAFIKYVVDPDLLPKGNQLPRLCTSGEYYTGLATSYGEDVIFNQLYVTFNYPGSDFDLVTYYIINSNYPISGNASKSMLTNDRGIANFLWDLWYIDGPWTFPIYLTIRVVSPACYFDWSVDL